MNKGFYLRISFSPNTTVYYSIRERLLEATIKDITARIKEIL